ncbi:uncharacterized protein [Henckelia pumila]|uniref:uncharacterized protein n=1 Tax=Henckelia pumila TaxID=405737 RepID=UPI003C6E5A0E
MFKQSSHRNQRTKGFKVKHVVQLCLLIGVCIWLLYQVRHSRGKNTSDQENSKASDKVKGGKEILNLGRKHLHPRASGDIEHRLNDDNMTEDTAGKETSKTVDGAREGTKQEEMKGKDKGDAGDMENDGRNRRGEDNENEKGKKKNRDQEKGGDKGNVKENKDHEIPEENESKEGTEEKHVDENNSQELPEKGTEENEVVQEGKSTEQSSGRGSREDSKEEEGLSRLMEERSKPSEIEFDGTTDKSNEVEKEARATGESTRNSPNITEIE